jgi:hypothetical protein
MRYLPSNLLHILQFFGKPLLYIINDYLTINSLDRNIRDWTMESLPPVDGLPKTGDTIPDGKAFYLLILFLVTTGFQEIGEPLPKV